MHAIAEGKIVTISADIGRALCGEVDGYRVWLHAMPEWVFNVESAPGMADAAVAACLALCKREGRALSTTAATFQRIERAK